MITLAGHPLTLTDGVLTCGAHPGGCAMTAYTLTPTQRVLIASAEDAPTKEKLLYTALVENRVRALAAAKHIVLPPDWTVRLDVTDPGRN